MIVSDKSTEFINARIKKEFGVPFTLANKSAENIAQDISDELGIPISPAPFSSRGWIVVVTKEAIQYDMAALILGNCREVVSVIKKRHAEVGMRPTTPSEFQSDVVASLHFFPIIPEPTA